MKYVIFSTNLLLKVANRFELTVNLHLDLLVKRNFLAMSQKSVIFLLVLTFSFHIQQKNIVIIVNFHH